MWCVSGPDRVRYFWMKFSAEDYASWATAHAMLAGQSDPMYEVHPIHGVRTFLHLRKTQR